MRVSAQKRTIGRASDLVKAGRLPGIVYNKETNIPVSLELREFDKAFRSQGTASIINLDIDGDTHDVLVKAVQAARRTRAAIGHALAFPTWHSLARDQGLSDRETVALMGALVQSPDRASTAAG